jgi:hypothetical protein
LGLEVRLDVRIRGQANIVRELDIGLYKRVPPDRERISCVFI